MKRRIKGLEEVGPAANQVPNGVFLVRVDRAKYLWVNQKGCYDLRFLVLEPREFANRAILGRLYCTERALWKLNWFLRDFGYDAELVGRGEVDDKRLIGLTGVVKIAHTVVNGRCLIDLEAFASVADWAVIDHEPEVDEEAS
jgi:hypothetical protein